MGEWRVITKYIDEKMSIWTDISSFFTYNVEHPLMFNTGRFFVLFVVFYGVFIGIRERVNLRTIYVLAFSLLFYYLSSGYYFVLLLFSTLVDFVLGHYIYRAKAKGKRLFFLWMSIAVNLGLLSYFKYNNFFIGVVNDVLGSNFAFTSIFLPVGISFYTFQTMSYSIDIYREKLEPLSEGVRDIRTLIQRLLDFGFFVSFFPQLVAGPIVRAADFIPQIYKRLTLTDRQLSHALVLIMGGLFKKAIISDYISVNFVDRVFESPTLYSGFENLMAAYGYAVQIYCDFSGYSDMAIGLALLMGFRLPINFNRPYQATSFSDFWRRWHISLSTWLRDYLYISLGGNRKGRGRTYVNLMLTMLLGGLWHGANWVFVIWGGLHGVALAVERGVVGNGQEKKTSILGGMLMMYLVLLMGGVYFYRVLAEDFPELFSIAIYHLLLLGGVIAGLVLLTRIKIVGISTGVSRFFVFNFVTFSWIFFRSGSARGALTPTETFGAVVTQIVTAFHPELIVGVVQGYAPVFSLIALGFLLHFSPSRWKTYLSDRMMGFPLPLKAATLAFVIWLVIQVSDADVVPFVYFQF